MNKNDTALFVATIKLFKRLPYVEKENNFSLSDEQVMENLRKGFVLSDDAIKHSMINDYSYDMVVSEWGYGTSKFNNTFFESIDKIEGMKDEEYYLHQILNYVTFNMNDWGLVGQDEIYVPNEKIGLAEDLPPYHLTIVKTIDKEEAQKKIEGLLYSGVALKSDTITNIFIVSDEWGFTDKLDAEKVKNKEAKLVLYKKTNTVPKSPNEFVKYLVYLATGATMFVKNKSNYFMMDCAINGYFPQHQDDVNAALNVYVSTYGYEKLASVFRRHKKIFLIAKNSANAHIINKIRRLADKCKVAPKVGILDRLTTLTADDMEDFKKEISKLSLFKKVALANFAFVQSNEIGDSVYFIRNGKVFFREGHQGGQVDKKILQCLVKSIVEEAKSFVKGKKFYLPKEMTYAFPTSEKKFIGGIPSNSKFVLDREGDTLLGIHWLNAEKEGSEEGCRTDLDLHITSVKGRIGWNSYYRDSNSTTIFTGDMTNAPRNRGGAAELMYFKKSAEEGMYSVTVNNYTDNHYPFPYSFVVSGATEVHDRVDKELCNSFVDNSGEYIMVRNYLKSANNTIGYYILKENKVEFIFTDMQLGDCVVPNSEDFDLKLMNYITKYTESVIKLKDILDLCRAEYVETPTEDCINLDYRELGATTILDVFTKKD